MSNGRLRAVACALALAATIAGCSSTSSPRTGAPGPSATTLRPPGAGCPVEAAKGTAMRLTSPSGNSIATVVLGGGTSAVVLAHQNHEDLCQWLPYGERLAGLGYRVLAFDFVGFGNSTYRTDKTYVEDITTVVTYLRGQGVTKVVLIGASMGGTMTVAAAASITPPVDGIVALSAPSVFDGVDAVDAVTGLTMPEMFIAGGSDLVYVATIRAIYAAAPPGLRRLLVVDSNQHGVRLLAADVDVSSAVRGAVETFLATVAPPTR